MNLLLDIDGVLQFPRAGFFAAMEREYRWSSGYAAFLGELFEDAGYMATLAGHGDFLAVADRILARHTSGLTAEEFLARWAAEGIERNQTLLDAVPSLAYDAVYLASNQEPLRGAYVERLYAGHAWIARTFLSHRVGCCKPSPDYFARVLSELGCGPETCVFVDDAAANVAAAAAAGMRAILFENTEQTIAALRQSVRLY